jgi:hypothetical protein
MGGHADDPVRHGCHHELRRIVEGIRGVLLAVVHSDGSAVQPEDLVVILGGSRPYFYVHVG